VILVNSHNCAFRDLALVGTSDGLIKIGSAATVNDTTIENIFFNSAASPNMRQCVWLWDCTNVVVNRCTFDTVGYGVVQQIGKTVTALKVTGNTIRNAYSDFVCLNGAGSGLTTDALIE